MSNARQIADVAPTLGRKNLVMNGDFQVWQRGNPVTITNGVSTYAADRWVCYCAGATGYAYRNLESDGSFSMKINATAGITSFNMVQKIESINSTRCVNKKVTLSGKIYVGVNRTISLELKHANTTDNFSATTVVASTTIACTAGANAFSWTVDTTGYPVDRGIYLHFMLGDAQSGSAYGLNSIQLEIGDQASTFEKVDYASEVNRCMRYYEVSGTYGRLFWGGNATSGVNYYTSMAFRVPKRTATPTMTVTNSSVNGFGTTPGTPYADAYGVQEARNATSTTNGAFYATVWAADAEL